VELYRLLETEVVPEFYERDAEGLPRRWLARVRSSMCHLTPRFSTNRMLRDYVETIYLPAARGYHFRAEHEGTAAEAIECWHRRLREHWHTLRIGEIGATRSADSWRLQVAVYCGELEPDDLRVDVWAVPIDDKGPVRVAMERAQPIAGAFSAFWYTAEVPTSRPAEHYTPRVVPAHPDAEVPMEAPFILWQK
jgi:starch phosphorylase